MYSVFLVHPYKSYFCCTPNLSMIFTESLKPCITHACACARVARVTFVCTHVAGGVVGNGPGLSPEGTRHC